MQQEILQYLNDNNSGKLIPLNEFLQSLLGNKPVHIYKGLLRGMLEKRLIELSGSYGTLGATYAGVEQNLNNIPITGRILPDGETELKKIILQNKQLLLTEKKLNEKPKPFAAVLLALENWCMRSWRKWISIPIFLLFILIPIIVGFIEGFTKLSTYYNNKFGAKEVYAYSGEKTAFNEWITLVDKIDNEDKANIVCKDFKQAYDNSKHRVWINDIFCVKSDLKKGEWYIIIDTWPGPSSKEEVQEAITDMQNYCKEQGRDIGNTLGRKIKNAIPHFYDSVAYIKLYGEIINPGKE